MTNKELEAKRKRAEGIETRWYCFSESESDEMILKLAADVLELLEENEKMQGLLSHIHVGRETTITSSDCTVCGEIQRALYDE